MIRSAQSTFFKIVLFAFSLISLNRLGAQTYSFNNYSVQDGLAQSNVVAIIQDKQGYLWLGTESGLSRFDGKNFQNFSVEDGLGDNNISTMLLDKTGNIWLGHGNGKVTRYKEGKFQVLNAELLPKERKIYSLFEDESGKIWISAAAYGVALILHPDGNLNDPNNYKTYKAKDGLSEYVFSIYQSHDNTIWFLTDALIKYFVPNENRFEFFKAQGLPALQPTCMLEDKEGNFWIGTYSYTDALLVKINRKTHSFNYYVTKAYVRALLQDTKGNIWAATWGNGIFVIDTKGNQKQLSTENGLVVNKIYSLYEDREGNILFGTYGNGLGIYQGEKFVSYSTVNGLVNDQIWAINQDKLGDYWFGTNDGLSMFKQKVNSFVNTSSITNQTSNDLRVIKKDKYGDLWVVVGFRLYKYDAIKHAFKSLSKIETNVTKQITSLEFDADGLLWIGTVDGIIVFNPNNNEIVKSVRTTDGLAGNEIDYLFKDSKGGIWICCKDRGLSLYKSNKCSNFFKEDGLTSKSVVTVSEDNDGRIIIGTQGAGIYIYDGRKFKNIKSKDGLVSDHVSLLVSDKKNNLWIGTNKGLSKYNSASKQFYNYGKLDGFKSIETKPNAVYKDSENNLWFGTVNGVTKYNLEKDNINSTEPLLNLVKVKINDKEVDYSDGMELDYKQNSFTFDYVGICFSNPEEVKYQVMLQGRDDSWRAITKQTYYDASNLPSGKYTFKLIACNNSGVWSKKPLTFSFTINPPWYQTWWFYIISIASMVVLIGSYIKLREGRLIKEKKLLEDTVAERTAEIVIKNNELDEKNKEITASIRYAKRIQDAILPPDEYVKSNLPNTFILYKPKDIVSGDFYWVYAQNDKVLFAAVDCTGHGVPGAFMSIIGHNLLEQIVAEQKLSQPSEILDALNKSVSETLRQSKVDESVKDGMDIALCCFDKTSNEIQFAGAFNPFYLVKNKMLTEIKGNKFPIGNLKIGEQKMFTNHSVSLQKEDTVYIFSDGFADQFGGPNGKKFKYNAFKELLISIQDLDMSAQKEILNKTIEDWKGNLEQVDDILIIGTRFIK